MTGTTIIVAGLGRCGTSLVMSMLDAAGFETVGEAPDFEDTSIQRLLESHPEQWAPVVNGRAVKVLDAHRWKMPAIEWPIIIWLTRDHKQQAKSALKLLNTMAPVPRSRAAVREMAASYRSDEPAALKAIKAVGPGPLLHMTFEQIIDDPMNSALEILTHCGTRDARTVANAAGIVLPRTSDCLPYLIEQQYMGGPL